MQTTHASVLRYISTSFGSRACLSLSHQSGHNPKHTHVKTSESTLVYHIHPTIDYCPQSSFDRKTFDMSRSCIIPTTANFLGGSGTNPPPNTPEKPKGGKRYRLGALAPQRLPIPRRSRKEGNSHTNTFAGYRAMSCDAQPHQRSWNI